MSLTKSAKKYDPKMNWCLTRVIDSVQTDSPRSHKASNPLQLTLTNIVLENNVIGETHIVDFLQRVAVLDCILLRIKDSHCLALVDLNSFVNVIFLKKSKSNLQFHSSSFNYTKF